MAWNKRAVSAVTRGPGPFQGSIRSEPLVSDQTVRSRSTEPSMDLLGHESRDRADAVRLANPSVPCAAAADERGGGGIMVAPDVKAETMKLMDQRGGLELEMDAVIARLTAPGGPGITGGLVDAEVPSDPQNPNLNPKFLLIFAVYALIVVCLGSVGLGFPQVRHRHPERACPAPEARWYTLLCLIFVATQFTPVTCVF